jgi:nucleoside-diphosphate-sugar epimerase
MRGRRVLVTGGCGFVGSHLVRRLVGEEADVHVLSRRTGRSLGAVSLPPGAHVHVVDLLSGEVLRSVVKRVGATHVFHLAGRVDLDRSLEIGQACVSENVIATLNLLHALRGTPIEALVYTSTTEVYGRNDRPFREDQAVDPPSAYAVSKIAGEQLCRIHAELDGYRLCVLRLATGYGPGQRLERLVPATILACLRGTPVRLHSPHHQRDFTYVGDFADGIVRAAARTLPAFEVINLGSEAVVSVVDLVGRIIRIAGAAVPVEISSMARSNEAPCWSTHAGRARRLLDWMPVTSLDDGLARTFRWYADSAMAATS